jgi:DNA repair protein RecO
MAYHVHHTEAIILGGHPVGEGDRLLRCYTKELGLVFARVTSVREQRSRLRYALQSFSYVEADMIRGKHGWKLISAQLVDPFALLWSDPVKRRIVAQYAQLLARLIQGEERHDVIFDELLTALYYLHELSNESDLRAAELVFVVRILAHLGYWDSHDETPVLRAHEWSEEVLRSADINRTALLAGVNRALAASQL